MTREDKIEAIYKDMANKEMSFWCLAKTNEDKTEMICSKLTNDWTSFSTIPYPDGRRCWFTTIYNLRNSEWINLDSKRTIKEIIWHPVMIGDVLRQIRLLAGYALDNDLIKKSDFGNVIAQHNYRITQIWEDFREPIEDQSDECIDYVYSLIQKD